ncbi:MAG: hypothetical protein V4614_12985 [Pseudomonadota bacterium]
MMRSPAIIETAPRPRKSIPERLLPWLALLGGLTGAIFSGVQFLEAKSKARVDRVFSYVTEFKAEPLRKSYLLAQTRSDSITEEIKDFRTSLVQDTSLPREQKAVLKRQKYFDQYIQPYRGDADYRAAMDRLYLFYEEVSICARENLCDDATVRSFFQQDASAFLENSWPIICSQRVIWNDEKGLVTFPAQQKFFKDDLLRCS